MKPALPGRSRQAWATADALDARARGEVEYSGLQRRGRVLWGQCREGSRGLMGRVLCCANEQEKGPPKERAGWGRGWGSARAVRASVHVRGVQRASVGEREG